jgi:hypothetical protein
MKSREIHTQSALTLRLIAILGLMATMVLFANPVWAQSNDNPPDRICILVAMLGGTLPPHCLAPEEDEEEESEDVQAQLDMLQLSVMPFFNYDVAVAAGWDTILGGCVESPMGGMGYHLHNMDQFGNGQLNLLRPEILLYAPTEDGSMEFVGVEYVIPAALWEEEEPPHFFGRHLHFNPNVGPNGIWALHVWVGKHNPNGVFDDWNPDVSCQFAPEG